MNLNELPPNFQFAIIVLIVFYVCTKMMNIGPGYIFAFLVSSLIIYTLQNQEKKEFTDINEEIDFRNNILKSPSHFYLDTNLINLFYSVYRWRSKNPNNFDLAIKAANNVLQIENDSEKPLLQCASQYSVAVEQSQLAMNFMHGFIYNIDQPLLVNKLKRTLVRLQELLERHIKNIQNNCESVNKYEINVNTKYIEDADGPKPYDKYGTSQFNVY